MRAVVYESYGLDALEVQDVAKPAITEDEVLVHVRAASLNPADWYTMKGQFMARTTNGLRKPKNNRLGTDLAGTVEAIGANVKQFRPGDDVFGARTGAFAEYVSVPEDRALVLKPANVTFEEAAGVAIAGVTALQGLRDKAQVQPGQKVLVNGASGGVGTFAVQIAKSLGAEVTAVCSTRNVDIVRSLGADHVVDYTGEDFTRTEERYDAMFDVAGNRSWSDCRRVLKPHATFVIVGAPKSHPLRHVAKMLIAGRLRGSQKTVFFLAKIRKADLDVLRGLLESGQVKPVVDRVYELSDIADAYRYLGEGHAQGKVVVTT